MMRGAATAAGGKWLGEMAGCNVGNEQRNGNYLLDEYVFFIVSSMKIACDLKSSNYVLHGSFLHKIFYSLKSE